MTDPKVEQAEREIMDYNEEFCEILKAYMGAESIVSVDAEPLSRGVKALRQFASKLLREEIGASERGLGQATE